MLAALQEPYSSILAALPCQAKNCPRDHLLQEHELYDWTHGKGVKEPGSAMQIKHLNLVCFQERRLCTCRQQTSAPCEKGP